MPRTTPEILRQMVELIVEEVDPLRIILFGSQARGDADEASDIDLIVLESGTFGAGKSRTMEEVKLYHALAGFHVSKDILVYSQDDAEYWQDSLNHVLARALREGQVLYERH